MNFMGPNFGYIPLQYMNDGQIAALSLDELRSRPLDEFFQVNSQGLTEESQRVLLRSRTLPEQVQIQMAWRNPTQVVTQAPQPYVPIQNVPNVQPYNPVYNNQWYGDPFAYNPQGYFQQGYVPPHMAHSMQPPVHFFAPPPAIFPPPPVHAATIPQNGPLGQLTAQAIQNLSRSDLEHRPLHEFAGLTTEQATALDSLSLSEEQKQTVLNNLRDANSRQKVEGEYALQNPFPVRWNAVFKNIEYYIWDAKYQQGGWGRPDGEVYADALGKHDESHVRRERLNAPPATQNPSAQIANAPAPYDPFFSGQYEPYATSPMYAGGQLTTYPMPGQSFSHFGAPSSSNTYQSNTPATPNPQTAREIELSEDIVKIAGNWLPAVERQTAEAIEAFRDLAASDEYNLDANQIDTLLKNYSIMAFDIARTPSVLGVPFESLVRMTQVNEGGKWPEFITMPRAVEKLIGAYRQFFQNHAALTDFGIEFERRAPLLELLHRIRELQELSKELGTHHRLLGYHVDTLRKRKIEWVTHRDYDRPMDSEDQPSSTLKVLVDSSQTVKQQIERSSQTASAENQNDLPLLSTVKLLADSGPINEAVSIDDEARVRKFIDSENLPALAIPDQMLWRDDDLPMVILRMDDVQIDAERLNNDIAAAPPFIDAATPFIPENIPEKIFRDLLEQADEELKQYFSEDTENGVFKISPEIFKRIEDKLKERSEPFLLKLIERQVEHDPAKEQEVIDAKAQLQFLKGLKALSRICDRLPQTRGYDAVEEDTKKWLGEFLLTVAVDKNFREANSVQFITALAACNDQVLDAVKALKTAYIEYQKEKGNLSTQQIIQFDVEQGRLETLGKIATLEIYAKLKEYPRSSRYLQPIHVKQTLEVKVGHELHMITTPKDSQYPDPRINDARVKRALQIIDAVERGDKAAAAAHLAPLIQEAEEGVQAENQRIEAANIQRVGRGETPHPLEKNLSDNFKDINNWSSERERLLTNQSMEFRLRRKTEFSNSFNKRKADLDQKSEQLSVDPDKTKEPGKYEAWEKLAEEHAAEVKEWSGDLVMSLVQVSKAARIRVQTQSSESPQDTYTVQPPDKSIVPSEKHPTVTEDFYRMELEIAKETYPSLKAVVIAPTCEAAHKPGIWFAAQLQGYSADGYIPQPADHKKVAEALVGRLEDIPSAKISERFNTTIAKPQHRLGDLFVVKIDKSGDAWIKSEGKSFSLIKVNAEDIKGIPLKAGQRTPVDFAIGELKWSNTNAQDNLAAVDDFNKRIEVQERERQRFERLSPKTTAQSSSAASDRQRLQDNTLEQKPIAAGKQYNELLFLQKTDDNENHLFAAINRKGNEVLLIGNPPSTEQLTPGDVFSFNKGVWERKTPALVRSQEPASPTRTSSPESSVKKQDLDSDSQLAGDRQQLEKDAGLPKGITIEFYKWNGKHSLTAPFVSITSKGAYTQMQIGQSATPKAVFSFISNEQLQQLGLLDHQNRKTPKGEEHLQKDKILPKELQRTLSQGVGIK